MNTKQVEAISKLLRDSREIEPPRVSPEARGRAIGALEDALRARARGRRRAKVLWATLAVAAVAAASLGTMKLTQRHDAAISSAKVTPTQAASEVAARGSEAEHVELSQGLALADGSVLQPGSRIVAPPKRHAVLSFSSGTQLTVGGGGDVTVVETGDVQRFLLSSGSIEAHVAKLRTGQRWLVSTPDSEVEVRGTAFHVAVVAPDPSCGGGTRTRVSVSEGVVSVRTNDGEVRVHPGEVWPAGCRRATASSSPNAASEAATTTTTPEIAAAPTGTAQPITTSHSTLAEQNDAFAQIVTLRQRGDLTGCATEVDRFLAKFPSSPLAESARVEQMRALRTSDPARAVAYAKTYLAQYPNGFARAEAQSIVNP